MNWKTVTNGIITAALSGGSTAAAQLALDPAHFDYERTGAAFMAGAVIGVINWLRQTPWQLAPPKV